MELVSRDLDLSPVSESPLRIYGIYSNVLDVGVRAISQKSTFMFFWLCFVRVERRLFRISNLFSLWFIMEGLKTSSVKTQTVNISDFVVQTPLATTQLWSCSMKAA